MNDHEQRIMFSSSRADWETPEWLLRRIEREFGKIGLDIAAGPNNNVAEKFFSVDDDALEPKKRWAAKGGTISFLNPPYGRTSTPAWIRRAHDECLTYGAEIVCVIPARTETTWFQEICAEGDVYFLKGRVSFCIDAVAQAPAPFPTAVVHFFRSPAARGRQVKFVDWRDK
jgi:phage N-6-adenine-methyltransferase